MTHPVHPQKGLDAIKAYVPGKPIDEVKREFGLDDVVKLASNENPLGVAPHALAAMRAALDRINVYPDGASFDLRTALADRFSVAFEQVAVGNGADDLILQTSMAYLDEGDEVVVSRTSFPIYDVYASAMRAIMIKTPLAPGYRIDLEAMADAITDRTKLVYLCNPNNPTGTIVSQAEVDRFLARVPERVLIILDEAYAEMVDSRQYPDSLHYVREGRKNIMVLRTFSKVYGMAGVRLGYAFAHANTIAPLFKVKPAFTVNVLAQAAGIGALQDSEFLAKSVEVNRSGRQFLYGEFERLGLDYAESHTNFILVRIGAAAPAVHQGLLKRGMIVRPCGGYELPEFLRVSIGTQEQNERFIATLEEALAAEPVT